MNNTNETYDFDKWSTLANKDPQAFEERRQQLINEFIMELPEDKRQRMRCLQWRVDSVRRLSKTPMAACIAISRMMWDSIKGENGLLDTLNGLAEITRFDGVRSTYKPTVASILKFPAANSKLRQEIANS